MNEYYVYAYLDHSNIPYYIGKGTGDRAYARHPNVTKPAKSKIVFLENNLTEEDSLRAEQNYIKQYGRLDLGTGILQNKTPGGNGGSRGMLGKKHSIESRQRMSSSLRGKPSPNKGKRFSLEYRQKLSESHKGQIPWMLGKNHSAQTRQKIAEKNESRKKKVTDGIRIYSSVTECASCLGMSKQAIRSRIKSKYFTLEFVL